MILAPLQEALQLHPLLFPRYLLSMTRIWDLVVVMGEEQGKLRSPVLRKPLGGSTNPFPNLGLVSMGQDVDVRLQGAGFNDHLVPGVGWGGDTAAQPDQSRA